MSKRYSSRKDAFTNRSISLTHYETGYTFTARGFRVDITHNGDDMGHTYALEGYAWPDGALMSEARLRSIAAQWLTENVED